MVDVEVAAGDAVPLRELLTDCDAVPGAVAAVEAVKGADGEAEREVVMLGDALLDRAAEPLTTAVEDVDCEPAVEPLPLAVEDNERLDEVLAVGGTECVQETDAQPESVRDTETVAAVDPETRSVDALVAVGGALPLPDSVGGSEPDEDCEPLRLVVALDVAEPDTLARGELLMETDPVVLVLDDTHPVWDNVPRAGLAVPCAPEALCDALGSLVELAADVGDSRGVDDDEAHAVGNAEAEGEGTAVAVPVTDA